MLMLFFIYSMFLIFFIIILFFFLSKNFYWDYLSSSSFECGFSSYFFSHYSFSMHYYLIGLIFLFLDLELCFLMPFFNGETSSLCSQFSFFFFILILTTMVLLEWGKKKLEWKF